MPLGGAGVDDAPLLRRILALTGAERPRLCYLPTAAGDPAEAVAEFHTRAALLPAESTDVTLFRRDDRDLEQVLLSQDAIYVGGGNTANMLAVWRVHGVDRILREAWRRGIVLTGASAGAICWFDDGVTDSFGPTLRALGDGLGFLKGTFCPHFDSEPQRRPIYTQLIGSGALAPGWAADDHAGILFEDGAPAGAISSHPDARAYRVEPSGVSEMPAADP